MKLYKNVLTQNTLALITKELNDFIKHSDNWTCSNFIWMNDIKVNISGTTMLSFVGKELTQFILEDLKNILPPISNPKLQYYVWTPNSGISCHDDGMYKFGATIYLNQSWNINDGGIFMYQHDGDDWRAHIPTLNTMVVNDTNALHLVTPVSPFAKHNRYTIQIFGDLKNE